LSVKERGHLCWQHTAIPRKERAERRVALRPPSFGCYSVPVVPNRQAGYGRS
jgi:hypothetical protein